MNYFLCNMILIAKGIQDFYNEYPIFCNVCIFLMFCLADDHLPEDSSFKIVSKAIKWFGNLITAGVREEISSTNKRLDMNHEESIKMIEETKQEIRTVECNRKIDSQVIMRDMITAIYREHQTKGYILENDKKDFISLFNRYTTNGGNSYVQEDIAPFIRSLPKFSSDIEAKAFYEEHGNYNNGTENL